jgi:ribosomal protein S18 acetylase RimI-like enzyme
MIREMKHEEEDSVRTILAKLDYEDHVFHRKQAKSLEQWLAESSNVSLTERIEGKNVVFVAEEDGKVVGLCWCTVVDRGVDKQGEIAEFYVEEGFRGKGIGNELIAAAKQFFINEKVTVAFVWTHRGNESAIELYKNAGFKEVDQLVMAFAPPKENENQHV